MSNFKNCTNYVSKYALGEICTEEEEREGGEIDFNKQFLISLHTFLRWFLLLKQISSGHKISCFNIGNGHPPGF